MVKPSKEVRSSEEIEEHVKDLIAQVYNHGSKLVLMGESVFADADTYPDGSYATPEESHYGFSEDESGSRFTLVGRRWSYKRGQKIKSTNISSVSLPIELSPMVASHCRGIKGMAELVIGENDDGLQAELIWESKLPPQGRLSHGSQIIYPSVESMLLVNHPYREKILTTAVNLVNISPRFVYRRFTWREADPEMITIGRIISLTPLYLDIMREANTVDYE